MVKRCELCKKYLPVGSIIIDGKTKGGPWAVMCEDCFKVHGVGLGVGKGQAFTTGEKTLYRIEGRNGSENARFASLAVLSGILAMTHALQARASKLSDLNTDVLREIHTSLRLIVQDVDKTENA